MQARYLSRTHADTPFLNSKRSLKLPGSSKTASISSSMAPTSTMTALDQVRARSNSTASNKTRRSTRVHFEIQEATPEFYGSRWLDMLSLYSGSSSFEVAIAALCSLGLFVAVRQGFLGGTSMGVALVGGLFVVSILHWALVYLFGGPQASSKDTLAQPKAGATCVEVPQSQKQDAPVLKRGATEAQARRVDHEPTIHFHISMTYTPNIMTLQDGYSSIDSLRRNFLLDTASSLSEHIGVSNCGEL
ncbi:hypothetical protein F5Y17DRAFT_476709 [Xylariaceae sp. FL0594]|nr:hypothetical protein F5Y17DRAFT_476709 [Xylariaceae sp. FL0594]